MNEGASAIEQTSEPRKDRLVDVCVARMGSTRKHASVKDRNQRTSSVVCRVDHIGVGVRTSNEHRAVRKKSRARVIETTNRRAREIGVKLGARGSRGVVVGGTEDGVLGVRLLMPQPSRESKVSAAPQRGAGDFQKLDKRILPG